MELVLPALDRVVARYRRDVNVLPPPAAPDALGALEGHLGRRLPLELRRFLALHNGATLFRGTLRLRSTSEIAVASAETPQVILFADGPGERQWALAETPGIGHVYGTWNGDQLTPDYASFAAWVEGEIGLVEARVVRDGDRDALRREAAPADPIVLTTAGRHALAAGRPDEAEALLREATRRAPDHVGAWQLLGEALAIRDRTAARQAWLQAFRRMRFPLPWPGAPCLAPDVFASLALSFADDESWEQELRRWLAEHVSDVDGPESAAVVEAAARALGRSLVRRGRRRDARDVLVELLSKSDGFRCPATPWRALLELAIVEIGLGHHDDAETHLRRLTRDGPAELKGEAAIGLAEIAVSRQEPWAEDIFAEADGAGLDEAQKLRRTLLEIERAVRQDRRAEATKAAARLDTLERKVHVPGFSGLTSAGRASGSGPTRFAAAVALARGDVERAAGRLGDARALWQKALAALGRREASDDSEIAGRLQLRIADLAWDQGDPDRAIAAATAAAEAFRALELPVREGWALLRLARFRSKQDDVATRLRALARDRFVQADLAAGVAAIDSLAGDPGASLAWHLERASAQARARHDAQRCRPPYERADADRPERRLGAHRLAVAACDRSVVAALAHQMDVNARAGLAGRGRATDPPVLRYVAAVDLLSGHRSYEAAAVLLEHLFHRGLDGTMEKALEGAIARSPNAALVDGLLRAVERSAEHPANAVAAAAELLGLRKEQAAVKPLVHLAANPRSPSARKAAIVALGRIGDRSVVDSLVPALGDPRTAEHAALALLMLGDRRGVDFHARALVEERSDLSGSPGEIVGRYGGPEHLLLLVRAAAGDTERSLGALQGLGLLGDVRGVPALLQALHSRERRTVEVASGALEILTGRSDNADEPGIRTRWHQWWDEQQQRLAPGVRIRHGQPFTCALLIDRMAHDDPYVRRTAYDELVIMTGSSQPFDADGPWRVQQAHLRAWRAWWMRERHRFPTGVWIHDGRTSVAEARRLPPGAAITAP